MGVSMGGPQGIKVRENASPQTHSMVPFAHALQKAGYRDRAHQRWWGLGVRWGSGGNRKPRAQLWWWFHDCLGLSKFADL